MLQILPFQTRIQAKDLCCSIVSGAVLVLVLSSLMIYRYFDLQIVRHQDYITNSNNNRIHIRPVLPPRGLIFDNKGILLADNRPTYTLNIIADRTQTVDDLVDQLRSLITISITIYQPLRSALNRVNLLNPSP